MSDGLPVVSGSGLGAEDLLGPLRDLGLVVVEGLLRGPEFQHVQTELRNLAAEAPFGSRSFDGYATRRVFDPLARTRVLNDVIGHPLLIATIEALIGPCQLGMTVLSNVCPGESAQRIHRDVGAYPLPKGFGPVMLNTIWAIDDFTATNGATVVARASHKSHRSSADHVKALAPVTMPAGSVLLYDGRVVHGAGQNTGESGRLGLIVEYVARWLRPNENHTLAVPLEIAKGLTPELQQLLGYNQLGPYMGFVAGLPPEEWLRRQ